MAQNETWLKHDLLDAVKVQYLDGNLFSMDNAGNLIGVTLTRDGEDYSGGGSVSANVIRSDGGTVAVSGALSGKTATVVLPQAAYAVPGVVSIIVKLTASGQVTTIAALVANVYRSSTDTSVDPGTIIPSIQTLISQINTAVASIPADYSALWTKLAPAFSTDTSYVAGQYVTYNSGLYRFNTSHSGSWSSSDVTPVNLGGEISDLKSALSASVNSVAINQDAVYGPFMRTGDVAEIIISETTGIIKAYIQGYTSTNVMNMPNIGTYKFTAEHDGRLTINKAGQTFKGTVKILTRFDESIPKIENRLNVLQNWYVVDSAKGTSFYLHGGETVIIDVSTIESTTNVFIQGHTDTGIMGITAPGRYYYTAPFDGNLAFYNGNKAFNAVVYLYTDVVKKLVNLEWLSNITAIKQDGLVLEFGSIDSTNGERILYQTDETVLRTPLYMHDLLKLYFDASKYRMTIFGYNALGKFVGTYTGTGFVIDWRQTKAITTSPFDMSVLKDFNYSYRFAFKNLNNQTASVEELNAEIERLNLSKNASDALTEVHTVGTGKEFATFTEMLVALKDNVNPKTVYVYPGEYDIFAEMGGAQYMSEVDTSQSWTVVNHIVPMNTTIIGIGDVTLKWMPTDDEIIDQAHAFLFAPLNVSGNCKIENIKILCSNARYGIHDETSGNDRFNASVHEFKDVEVIYIGSTYGGKYAYGAGHNLAMKCYFTDCIFKAAYGDVWSTHDWPAEVNEGSLFVFNNCVFERSDNGNKAKVRFSSSSTGRTDVVKMNNCSLGGITFGAESGSSAIKQGYKVVMVGCNEISDITYVSRIAEADRIPPVQINPIHVT